jgi:hypothetical protein
VINDDTFAVSITDLKSFLRWLLLDVCKKLPQRSHGDKLLTFGGSPRAWTATLSRPAQPTVEGIAVHNGLSPLRVAEIGREGAVFIDK